jgi:hypothetical protein
MGSDRRGQKIQLSPPRLQVRSKQQNPVWPYVAVDDGKSACLCVRTTPVLKVAMSSATGFAALVSGAPRRGAASLRSPVLPLTLTPLPWSGNFIAGQAQRENIDADALAHRRLGHPSDDRRYADHQSCDARIGGARRLRHQCRPRGCRAARLKKVLAGSAGAQPARMPTA